MAATLGERLACGFVREKWKCEARERKREREREKKNFESSERQRQERMGCEFIGMVLL